MERVTRGMHYLSDELGIAVCVSEAQEDSTVEDRRVEVNAGEEKEEKEGGETKEDSDSKERESEEEGEHKEDGSESEKSESEISTSGQGRHGVSISVRGDSEGAQYNGNEREGEYNGTGERGAHPAETPQAASAMPGQRNGGGGRYDGAGALEAGMAGITFNNRDADMCIPPPAFASNEYQLRETFYCITRAAEFDLFQEDHHLTGLETWVAPAPVLYMGARVEEWGDPSACDLCDEPLLGIQLTTHRTLHCPLTGPGGDLLKEPQGPPSKVPGHGGTANSSYFCSVYNKSLPNKYEHLQSKKHLKKAGHKGRHRATPKSGVLLWAHTARRREMREGLLDREYCEVCSRHVAEMAEHANSIKHRRNEEVKLSAAKQHGAGTPSTQVAHTQPGSPVYPQQVLSRQPPPIPPGLFPPQLPPQVVAQPASRPLPPQVPRVTYNPVPCPVPRPAPEIQVVAPKFANSPYVRIMGDMFHCTGGRWLRKRGCWMGAHLFVL
ncbi:hypothetical protein DFP73DRAFT_530702 [Morchella snyderi]|nr:hypothetical protein DFP73DRAFT_530702 [Morchella snyderi]